jgi:hypothetical protein
LHFEEEACTSDIATMPYLTNSPFTIKLADGCGFGCEPFRGVLGFRKFLDSATRDDDVLHMVAPGALF